MQLGWEKALVTNFQVDGVGASGSEICPLPLATVAGTHCIKAEHRGALWPCFAMARMSSPKAANLS
jgi:hypothetical protein